MLIFKNTYDLRQLHPDHPFNHIIKTHLSKTGHLEGYLVLIEEGDDYIDLPEFKGRLEDIQWEGVCKLSGFYHAVRLQGNECALEFIIPDRGWLAPKIKANLEHHRT